MKFFRRTLLPMALLVAATSGAKCITVAENSALAINLDELTGEYAITSGATTFTNPNNCIVIPPSQYLDEDYGDITGGRLVNAEIQTIGAFGANISGGSISVNGVQIISYSGPWNTFNVPESLLEGTAIQRQQAGVDELIQAVQQSQTLNICAAGSFSAAAPPGLSVRVSILAQVDVQTN